MRLFWAGCLVYLMSGLPLGASGAGGKPVKKDAVQNKAEFSPKKEFSPLPQVEGVQEKNPPGLPEPLESPEKVIQKSKATVVKSTRRQMAPVSLAEDFILELAELSKHSKGQKTKEADQKAKEKISSISSYVDFHSLAKRSLGDRWGKTSAKNRELFIDTLKTILEVVAYPHANKISAQVEKFLYKKSNKDSNTVLITGEIEREKRGELILDDFEMELIFDPKSKKIVDAVIETEAISKNLKRQFDQAFQKKNFKQIIDLMKKRIDRARTAEKNEKSSGTA